MDEHHWRRRDIDRGKVLGVLLVVLGHLVARGDPGGAGWGAAWYEPLRAALYSFHIPFLFYLSGYAAGWSGAGVLTGAAYRAMLIRRVRHWLLPALLLGLTVTCGKAALHSLIPVDHPPETLGAGLRALIWQTDQSPAQSVWYLVVLFGFAVVVPPLLRLTERRGLPLLLLSLPLMTLPLPHVLYADRFLLYLPFYLAGIAASDQDRAWSRFLDQARLPLMAVFLSGLPVVMHRAGDWPHAETMVGVSLIALPALHAMSRRLWLPVLGAVDRLCPYVFAIYLLNTVFIGLAKAVLLQLLPWRAAWFPLFAPVLMTAGVFGPILTAKLWQGVTANAGSQRRA